MARKQSNLSELGQQISDTFNTSELQNLCLELSIDYEALPVPSDAAGKLDKVRALVLYCQRHGRLPDLLAALIKKRPSSDWQSFDHLISSPRLVTTPVQPDRRRSWWLGGLFVLIVLLFGIGWLWRQANSGELEATAVSLQPAASQLEETREAAVPPTLASAPSTDSKETNDSTEIVSGLPTLTPTLPPLSGLNVSKTPNLSYNPVLLIDEADALHFIWYDTTQQITGDIFYRQLPANGSWSEITILADSFDNIGQYALALGHRKDGQVCAFWNTSGGSQAAGYYMRCLQDDVWDSPQLILPAHGAMHQYRPAFAPDGSVYTLYANGSDLFFGDIQISDDIKAIVQPAFAIDSAGIFHAVWLRLGDPQTLEYRSSTDNGHSWSEPQRLAGDSVPADGTLSLIADGNGGVRLVWYADRKIYYRHWNAADDWSEPEQIVSGAVSNPCGRVALAIDGAGFIHVAWQGDDGLNVVNQADDSWTSPRQINTDRCDYDSPALAVDSQGNRHFIWNRPFDDTLDFYYAAESN